MKNPSVGTLLFCLATILAGAAGASAQAPALQDTLWTEDFENGTSCGWDSYPAFEDTAFDFTLISGRFLPRYHLQGFLQSGEFFYPVDIAPPGDAPNTRYLLRNYRPNSASPQLIGVVQKFPNLYAAKSTVVDFDYWLQLPDGKNRLRVDLAGGDGKRYAAYIDAPGTSRWNHARLPLSAFAARDGKMSAGTQIQAMVIAAELERGNPSAYVFVGVDNVKLVGQARVGFELKTPVSTAYKNWAIKFLDRQYHPGQSLSLEAVSDGGPLTAVTASLKTYGGKVVAENIPLAGGPEKFTASQVHTFTESERGPLTLTVQGKRADGTVAASEFRLWNVNPISNSHPGVMVRAGDKERLLGLMNQPQWGNIRADVVSAADQAIAGLRNGQPNSNPGGNGEAPDNVDAGVLPRDYLFATNENIIPANMFRRFCDRIEPVAWAYYYTGDAKYGEWAKRQMLQLVKWDTWNSPWFAYQGRTFYYPAGQGTDELGVAYDLIRPLLSDAEAAQVRKAIFEKGIKQSWIEWFENNRVPFSTSNWISHSIASPDIAMLAIAVDGPTPDYNAFGEPYFSTMAEKFLELAKRTMRADGGYGEGYSYQDYSNLAAQRFLYVLEHALGARDLTDDLNYTKGHLFPLYMTAQIDGKPRVLSMGDNVDGPVPGLNFTWGCGKSADPTAHWFNGNKTDHLAMLMSAHLLDIPAKSPAEAQLPAGRVFPLKGNAVFRSGWAADAAVMNLHAGPNYNHTHVDMGNFRFVAFGKELVKESGRVEYYHDPWFWGFFTQPGGHNCLLVDDNHESQMMADFDSEIAALRDYAKLTSWVVGDGASMATAELAPVYRNMLAAYERRLYFVQPGYVVFNDRVRSAGGAHQYQWQLYPPGKQNLTIDGGAARVLVDNVTLQVEVASPANPQLIAKDIPFPVAEYASFPKRKMNPRAILQVSGPASSSKEDFVVALLPRLTAGQPWKTEPVQGNGFKGIKVEGQGKVDVFCFKADGRIDGEPATDGDSCFVRTEGGKVTAAAVEGARSFKAGGKQLLESPAPINASCVLTGEGMKWSFNSPLGGKVSVINAAGELKSVVVKPGETTQMVR